MVTGSRSVKQLTELGDELEVTVSVLFAIFGLCALAAVVLMALVIPIPYGERLPEPLQKVPAIIGQGLLGFVGVLAVSKSGTIPGAVRRSLALRTQIAVDDARRKTIEKADEVATKTGFRTREGFGRVTSLSDLRSGDRSGEAG